MLKWITVIFLLLAGSASAGLEDDDWFDPAFIEANTLTGGTGFIQVPSPEVIPGGVISAAIHRYQIKIDYGLWDIFELGFTANLDGYEIRDLYHNQLFYGRARILSQERNGIGLSVGFDSIALQDFGFPTLPNPSLAGMERFYVVSGLPLPFAPSWMATAGWGAGAMPDRWFFNLSKVVIPGLLGMAEYDGFGTNFGVRFLLSPRIKLDLDLTHTQYIYADTTMAQALESNVWFGITYSEPWNLNLADLLPRGNTDAPKNPKPQKP
jgi:hypothetical protein